MQRTPNAELYLGAGLRQARHLGADLAVDDQGLVGRRHALPFNHDRRAVTSGRVAGVVAVIGRDGHHGALVARQQVGEFAPGVTGSSVLMVSDDPCGLGHIDRATAWPRRPVRCQVTMPQVSGSSQ